MRKQIIIGITAAIIGAGALTAGMASAQSDEDRCGDRDEGRHGKHEQMDGKHANKRLHRMAEKLDLTDAQTAQMKALFKDGRDEMKDQRDQIREMHTALRELDVNAADYDQQVAGLVAQAQENTAQMIQMRAQQKKEMFAILTPEQQEEFLQMRPKKPRHD
ncbi:Spy/CpxP family protein refolding chaperone [Amphritea sp. 1_MG-2023]|uniref:Spy/CpxP family protein refolding chaperone n=1 Tax=Amphritea sp. 1_MG-2023 TaxID=3062670 RepID=UPI0026E1C7B2|nr:Spy/CpxP family protein refolding chaperone [Amphritea sp. 1_MG-2023]MDO6564813.1 Spy/CpxP family protein refolding chaperone [Amphritea sp. 1_MG-2023]